MSWGTCYSGSNNIHFNFPPIMMDGRNFSSWQAEAIINERIQKKENINTNWDYRKFLTQNGVEIMKIDNQEYHNKFFILYSIFKFCNQCNLLKYII